MGTLTVPHLECDGQIFKECLDRFLVKVMRAVATGEQAKRSGASCGPSLTWFLEFQKRGAPHIHFFTNFAIPKDWLANAWANAWSGHLAAETILTMKNASTRIEWLRSTRGAKSYALKYGGKMEQKEVPDGYRHVGRFWGIRGCRERVAADIYRTPCSKWPQAFPGDNVRLFWIKVMGVMAAMEEVRCYQWVYGTGVTIYFLTDRAEERFTEWLKAHMVEFGVVKVSR
jgi:hypothetical protein